MNVSDTRASGMPVLVGWNRRGDFWGGGGGGGGLHDEKRQSSRAAAIGCLSLLRIRRMTCGPELRSYVKVEVDVLGSHR